MSIGDIMVELRHYQGMSVRELARRAAIKPKIIIMLETEDYLPKNELFKKILFALNMSLSDFKRGVIRPNKIDERDLRKIDKKVLWEKEERWALTCQRLYENFMLK